MLTDVPAGRVFGLDQQTLISVAIHLFNLCVLAFVMAKLLYKPVRDFMQKRNARIGDQIARVKQEHIEAEELRLSYEQKINNAELERDEMLAEAKKSAELQSERIIAQARSEAETILANAANEIADEKKRMQTEMRYAIIEISSAMAEKFVAISIYDDARERLFNQTVAELEGISWE